VRLGLRPEQTARPGAVVRLSVACCRPELVSELVSNRQPSRTVDLICNSISEKPELAGAEGGNRSRDLPDPARECLPNLLGAISKRDHYPGMPASAPALLPELLQKRESSRRRQDNLAPDVDAGSSNPRMSLSWLKSHSRPSLITCPSPGSMRGHDAVEGTEITVGRRISHLCAAPARPAARP
jgi:hypothetical protein